MFAFRVFILSFFVSFFGSSQGYFHSPNDTLWASTTLGQQVTMNITQVHTTNDTLQFIWQKVNVDLPFGWEATICDNSNCNLALIDGDTTLPRSEEHTSELQSHHDLVCRLLLEKK